MVWRRGTLLPPEDIMRIQDRQNRELEKAYRDARIESMTLRGAVAESVEAGRWFLDESVHGFSDTDLRTELTMQNRLRGLGLLLIFVASTMLVVYNL
jgi:hypothetical protein